MSRVSPKLQQLAKSFSEAYRYSQDVYWLSSPDFKSCNYISPVFTKIWGYSCKAMLNDNKVWDTYLLPSDLKNYHPLEEMAKKIKHEGPQARYNETFRIIRPDGQVRWILDRGHPIYDERGEYIGITGFGMDITDLKIHNQLPLQSWHKFPESKRQRYYLRGRYQKIYLTPSEAKCAFFLLQGKTARETAEVLELSPRTIEGVHDKIKNKFGVIYRSDLFEALIEGDFLNSLNSK